MIADKKMRKMRHDERQNQVRVFYKDDIVDDIQLLYLTNGLSILTKEPEDIQRMLLFEFKYEAPICLIRDILS